MFYKGLRLWEAPFVVFYEGLRRLGGRMSNHVMAEGGSAKERPSRAWGEGVGGSICRVLRGSEALGGSIWCVLRGLTRCFMFLECVAPRILPHV